MPRSDKEKRITGVVIIPLFMSGWSKIKLIELTYFSGNRKYEDKLLSLSQNNLSDLFSYFRAGYIFSIRVNHV